MIETVANGSPKSQRSSKSIIPGIGIRIQALVEGLGFQTQRALAKELGISKSTLNRYIKTDRCPDPHILLRLAKRGVSVDALLVSDRLQPKPLSRPTTVRVGSPGRPKKRPSAARSRR